MAAEPTLAASLMGEFSLAGRVAVITGAGSGIGRETAHVLAQAGARVVLADVNVAGLAQTEALVKGVGGPVAVVYPEGVWYTVLDQHDVDEIVESHLKNGQVVERLVIPADVGR